MFRKAGKCDAVERLSIQHCQRFGGEGGEWNFMELYYGLIVLGLVCLSAPFWAKLAGYETHRKPFDLVGAGGVFFMLAASFQLATSMSARFAAICNPLMIVSFIIGVVGLLIGAFWTASEVLRESDHGILGTKVSR
jgi:hypothetical protein